MKIKSPLLAILLLSIAPNAFSSMSNLKAIRNALKAPVSVIAGTEMQGPEAISKSTVRLIMQFKESSGQCTGSLIAENIILTAAHCLDDGPKSVRIDFYLAKGKFRSVSASRYLIHSKRKSREGNERNDLALIYFKGGVPNGHSPIEMLIDKETPEIDTLINISGFGMRNVELATYQESDKDDSVLVSATLSIISKLGDTLEFKDRVGKSSSCFGDSGGPAWIEVLGRPVLVGTSSFVTPPMCMNTSFYTSIAYHSNWIKNALEELKSPAPFGDDSDPRTVSSRSLRALRKQLKKDQFDMDKVKSVSDFVAALENKKILAEDALEILEVMSLDENRLEVLKNLSAHLVFMNRGEARELINTFKYENYKDQASVELQLDGIVEL